MWAASFKSLYPKRPLAHTTAHRFLAGAPDTALRHVGLEGLLDSFTIPLFPIQLRDFRCNLLSWIWVRFGFGFAVYAFQTGRELGKSSFRVFAPSRLIVAPSVPGRVRVERFEAGLAVSSR